MAEIYEKREKIGEATIVEATPEKPSEILLTPDEFVEQHKRIKRVIDEYAETGLCITPETIAEELKLEIPTIFGHLNIMEIDKSAKNVAIVEGRNVYCSYELINKLLNEMKS